VLRATFSTFEIREEERRFLPKLREDLAHLVLPLTGPVAAIGTWALATGADSAPPDPEAGSRRTFVLRILMAWTAVTGAGIAYGVATRNIPPHRFLAMLVAVPGSLALA